MGLGLGFDALHAANPALIYHSLAPFGQTGPYKHFKLSDGVVNAKSGRMRDQIGWQKLRPTFRAINDISYHTAMFTVQALVAALRVRSETGRGQRLEGSLLSGASAPNNNWRLYDGQEIPPDLYPGELSKEAVARGELTADRHESDPYTANPSQICLQTKDGRWIMHSHIQQDLFDSWIDTIGFGWIRDDPRYAKQVTDMRERLFDILEENGGMNIPLQRDRGAVMNSRNPAKGKSADFPQRMYGPPGGRGGRGGRGGAPATGAPPAQNQ